jgi:hypothetical protein
MLKNMFFDHEIEKMCAIFAIFHKCGICASFRFRFCESCRFWEKGTQCFQIKIFARKWLKTDSHYWILYETHCNLHIFAMLSWNFAFSQQFSQLFVNYFHKKNSLQAERIKSFLSVFHVKKIFWFVLTLAQLIYIQELSFSTFVFKLDLNFYICDSLAGILPIFFSQKIAYNPF